MLFVLADDFSGAAEIGGIGHRYGLRTEIQLKLDTNSRADMIVLDSDTRSLNADDAAAKIFEIATMLKKWGKPFSFFKKIDSVMRGHLIEELNVLQNCFTFDRILLLPANPGRGRKIIGGEYFVNDVRLHETFFSTDPDFPVRASKVAERMGATTSTLRHVHVSSPDFFPSGSIITGDVSSRDDLQNYVQRTGHKDLCCGAAELFESYLRHLGFSQPEKKLASTSGKSEIVLIINGSTIKNQNEQYWFEKSDLPFHSLPGTFSGMEFQLSDEAAIEWYKKVLHSMNRSKVAVVTIDHPVQQNKVLSERFLNYFAQLMMYITHRIDVNRIHFYITGGATASAIIRTLPEGELFVKEEVAPGVVTMTLTIDGIRSGCFTVKPGSYPWPEQLRDILSGKDE